jgi:ABC-type multidrug transport system fused ATPase/permease subunit
VLDSASLSIAPGETVVLLGANGTGKSTALMLLLGFLAPTAGRVTVGDTDLQAIDASSWRRTIAYLPEHPTLLSTTLRENLLLARPDASDAACVDALASAGASDFLDALPEGLSTRIGEGARTISAGERQRIALARVHIRRASLYLLDEPTVHLDDAAESFAVRSLSSAISGKSALIVTHRPALLEIADRVVVLRGGRFVEETHLAGQPARSPGPIAHDLVAEHAAGVGSRTVGDAIGRVAR